VIKTREEGHLCAVLSEPTGYGTPIPEGWQRCKSLQWILAFAKQSNSTQTWQQRALAVMKTNHVLGHISLAGQGSELPAVAQPSFGRVGSLLACMILQQQGEIWAPLWQWLEVE